MNTSPVRLVVVLLLVVAAGVVGVLQWRSHKGGAPAVSRAAAGTNAAPAASAAVAPTTAAVEAAHRLGVAPPTPIDRVAVQNRWLSWLNAPARDPFLWVKAQTAKEVAEVSPAQYLKLSATWLQTGSRLAVIDQRIYGEGDVVKGFKILRIGASEVLLEGPEKNDTITFFSYVPPPPDALVGGRNPADPLRGPEQESVHN
ncbi:MAG TPA: hypothetical protein PKM73_21040 [Verrucomicrobiota bacterium]|nr:hypothetical protein [Verrucomicrobiota bacterium]HNU53288.1 hypothetical protein [Verrucomicrobiota bacterium]